MLENKVSVGLMLHESEQYRRHKAYNPALEILQLAVKIAPNDESIHLAMGDVYYDLGMHEKAISSYENSLNLYPSDEVIIEKLKFLKAIADDK